MVPKQRRPGQTGGGGRHGQAGNRSRSQDRGGRPHAGGGGSGKKPGGGSSFVEDNPSMLWKLAAFVITLYSIPVVLVGGAAYYLVGA